MYSSLLCNWWKQRSSGKPLNARRGRKADPQLVEHTQLQRRYARLEQRLAKAEQAIDIQGKSTHSCALLPPRVRMRWNYRRGRSRHRDDPGSGRTRCLRSTPSSAWEFSAPSRAARHGGGAFATNGRCSRAIFVGHVQSSDALNAGVLNGVRPIALQYFKHLDL